MKFDPRDSREIDVQFRKFALAIKHIDEELAQRLLSILLLARPYARNNAHAIALVSYEIGRGINSRAKPPLVRDSNGMHEKLAQALAQAEGFGRDIAPYVLGRPSLAHRIFRRARLPESGKNALMKCVAIGVSQQRRIDMARDGKDVDPNLIR